MSEKIKSSSQLRMAVESGGGVHPENPPNPEHGKEARKRLNKLHPQQDHISLKWGSLKSWKIHTPEAQILLQQWASLGREMSAMAHHDTPEQKDLLCRLIDASNVDQVFLDWDAVWVSKEDAKKYIMNYGKNKKPL